MKRYLFDKSKMFILALSLIMILIGSVTSAQQSLALAEDNKPEENYPENLYFITMAGVLTVEWKYDGPQAAAQVRAYHLEGDKYYSIVDTDGLPFNTEARFKAPRTGHLQIEIRNCDLDYGSCDPVWVNGKDTRIPEEQNGWYLFVRPAPVISGGVE